MHLVRSLHLVYPIYLVLLLRPAYLVQQLPVHLLPPITLASYLPFIFMYCSFKICYSSLVIRPYTPSPLERAGVRIPFLSPRNPVFTIFSAVV